LVNDQDHVTAANVWMLLRETVGRTLQPVTLKVAPAVLDVAWPPDGVSVAVFVNCMDRSRTKQATLNKVLARLGHALLADGNTEPSTIYSKLISPSQSPASQHDNMLLAEVKSLQQT
jgi:hypothetical protein